jgi:hypothetical protein
MREMIRRAKSGKLDIDASLTALTRRRANRNFRDNFSRECQIGLPAVPS